MDKLIKKRYNYCILKCFRKGFYVNLTKMNGAASLVYQKDLINNIYDESRAQAEDEEILAQKRL